MWLLNLVQTLVSIPLDDMVVKVGGGLIAGALGILAHYGRQVVKKVDTVANDIGEIKTLTARWGVVLFGPEGGNGLYGDVRTLKEQMDRRAQSPDDVGAYDRRSAFRDDVEREKDRRRASRSATPKPNEG